MKPTDSMRFVRANIERRMRHLRDEALSRELSISRLQALLEHLPEIEDDLAKDALLELIG